jgi:hypothetical protein
MNPVPGKKDMTLILEGDLTAYNHQFRAGQTDVKVGSKITINSDLYQFQGVIIGVEEIR